MCLYYSRQQEEDSDRNNRAFSFEITVKLILSHCVLEQRLKAQNANVTTGEQTESALATLQDSPLLIAVLVDERLRR